MRWLYILRRKGALSCLPLYPCLAAALHVLQWMDRRGRVVSVEKSAEALLFFLSKDSRRWRTLGGDSSGSWRVDQLVWSSK